MTIKPILYFVLSLMIFSSPGFSQGNSSTGDKLKMKITTKEANSAFLNQNFESALELYSEVLNKDKKNSFLLYRIGFCEMEVNQLEEAVAHFELVKASQLKTKHLDFHYAYGRTLHKQGKFKTALTQYQLFEKNGRSKDKKYYEPQRFISQCNFALKAIENPVSAQISSVGNYINTAYDEKHPVVTLDGKKMYFSSRKRNEQNDELLADKQYYENVYVSNWDEDEQQWGESELVEGKLNSEGDYSAVSGISPDSKSMLIYKNVDKNNKKFWKGVGAGDIMLSKKGGKGLWSRPELIEGLNSEGYDGGACFSPDGNKIYFISDRSGIMHGKSVGQADIWVSEIQEDETWGKAKNLGPTINTRYNEINVFMHPDGKTLFFSSEGHYENSIGGYDVFKTELKDDGTWTAPINLGFPINTALNENKISLSADGQVAWIYGEKKTENRVDIFQLDLTFYDLVSGKSDPLSIVKGQVTDRNTKITVPCKIKFINKKTNVSSEVSTDDKGEYIIPLISNTSYEVAVVKEGYEDFSEELQLSIPVKAPVKKKRRPKRRKKGEKEKGVTAADILQVSHNFILTPSRTLNIINADLFNKQTVRFVEGENGFALIAFSKDALDNCVQQLIAEPEISLTITAHFDPANNNYQTSLDESKKLADIVTDYLISKGAPLDKVSVFPMGNSEPMSTLENSEGKEINRRVELKFSL